MVQTRDYRIQINEAGKGHPIILIHGGGPGATGWSNYAANIATLSRKFRCIAVTMPGWGESSPQSHATGRDAVGTIKQLMDTLGIDRAAFIGNSMGGGVAVAFTAEQEARVSHLITLGVGGMPGVNVLQPVSRRKACASSSRPMRIRRPRTSSGSYRSCVTTRRSRLMGSSRSGPSRRADTLNTTRTGSRSGVSREARRSCPRRSCPS